MDEKLSIYREEIKKYPSSIELREALFNILTRYIATTGKFKDVAIVREMANLAEDIIEMGGSNHYKSMLAFFSQDLDNPDLAATIVKDAPSLMYSKEVLLPTSLRGRARVEAQKRLIYRCAELIRSTVFDMYEHQEITDDERYALSSAENIFSYLYSESFARHFGNISPLYIGVKAAATRGDEKETLRRLDDMVSRLELMEKESVAIPTLVPEYEVELYYTSSLGLFNVRNQAKVLLDNVKNDFPAYLEQFHVRLERLCESDGGQLKEDCVNYIVDLAQKMRNANYRDPLMEEKA